MKRPYKKNKIDYFLAKRYYLEAGKCEFIDYSVALMAVEPIEVEMDFISVLCNIFTVDKFSLCFLYSLFYDLDICVEFAKSGCCIEEFCNGLHGRRFANKRLREWRLVIPLIGNVRSFFSEKHEFSYKECLDLLLKLPCYGLWGAWKLCDVLNYTGFCTIKDMRLGFSDRYGVNKVDLDILAGVGVSRMFSVNSVMSTIGFLEKVGFSEKEFINEFSELGVTTMQLESLLCKYGCKYKIGKETEEVETVRLKLKSPV